MSYVKPVGTASGRTPVRSAISSQRSPNHVAALLGGVLSHLRAQVESEQFAGLRVSQFRLLERVPPGGISISELAHHLGMTKQAGGQFVADLTERGYLRTVADPADGRARIITRTQAGDDVVGRLHQTLRGVEDQWADHVGQRRYATFRAVLTELLATDPRVD